MTGSDTLVNFTLDELVGGIVLIVISLLMAVTIFGLEMISFESMAIDLAIVALLNSVDETILQGEAPYGTVSESNYNEDIYRCRAITEQGEI